jgi:phage terminase large subunit GpA-like protein
LDSSWDRNRLPLYLVSSDEAKLSVANRMRIEKPGASYMHAPVTRPRDWFEQLCKKLVLVKGLRKWVNALRARNEAWDARMLAVYAACAIAGRRGSGRLV